jgi:hypothetical protein
MTKLLIDECLSPELALLARERGHPEASHVRHAPGSKGILANVSLHAGLVCVNGPADMDLALQKTLFLTALEALSNDPDLTNQVLEVSMSLPRSEIEILRYSMPPSDASLSQSPC